MNNKKDLITGIVLLAASAAVLIKFFMQKHELENMSHSVFFVNLTFVLFSLLLAGAGVKKIFFSDKTKPDKSDKDKTDL